MEYEKNLVVDDKFKATLTITLTKETVKREYDALLKKYSKEIAIPGFRRGKVPPSVLEAKYSSSLKDELKATIIEDVSKEVFEALPQEESPIYCSSPSLTDDVKIDLNSSFSFALTYDVQPKVEVKKWEGFELKLPSVSVTDEDVEKDIKAIQERNALIQAKGDDGVIENGDVVTLDYVCVGDEPHPIRRDDYVFTVGSSENSYNFSDDILGMKKGEKKEIVKNYPDDYVDESLRGTTKTITVTVKAIKQKILPNLDDDFAQDVSEEYKTFEDFKKATRKKIENALEGAIFERKKDLILDKLVEANPVFVPESMVLHEISRYYSNIASQYGVSANDFFRGIAGHESEYIENIRPLITKQLQAALITASLKKQNNIEANEEDIDAYIKRYADAGTLPFNDVKEMMMKPENKEDVTYRANEDKLLKLLFSKSVFEMGEELSLQEFLKEQYGSGRLN